MRKFAAIAVGLVVMTAMSPSALRAQTMWDVAHARANARAGGPISGYDADILERYGCLSGTTSSAFCRKLSHKNRRPRKGYARKRR